MSVTKLVFQSAMIAGILGASAHGGTILTLGLFSSPVNPPASNMTSNGSGMNLGLSNASSPVATTTASTSLSSFSSSPFPTSAPASTYQAAPASTGTYDAYINFGTNSFLNADTLTSGNPQTWSNSSKITGLFGGTPSAQQIASFDSTVLQRVQQTFAASGVSTTITDNPGIAAAHMLSVVSNAVNPSITNAIGMTNIGGNGFHFIDNSAPYASSVDQLEWIVAHNVAHELMLAFGVPEVNDKTGRYVDSTVGQMSMFLNPNATFSPGAVQDLLASDFLQVNGSSGSLYQPQMVTPTPEPATLAAWGLVAGVLVAARMGRSRRASTGS